MFKSIIMRSTRCLNMAFNLTKPSRALICLYDYVVDLTDHFADALVRESVACVYDIVAML